MKKSLITLILVVMLAASIIQTSLAASGTKYEAEPNNTYSQATRTYNDYDNYGYISSSGEVDWWVVSFPVAGAANFWLGNIPSNCDYELYVYLPGGTVVLGSSTNGGNNPELFSINIAANTNYYIRIHSYSGYSTSSQYLMRTKFYPSLDVPLLAQGANDTCGAANTRQMLHYYGYDYLTETNVINKFRDLTKKEEQYKNWYEISGVINYYAYGHSLKQYWRIDYPNITVNDFRDRIYNCLIQDKPLIILVIVPIDDEFPGYYNYSIYPNLGYIPYESEGHYLTISGISTDGTTLIIKDTWGGSVGTSGTRYVPVATLKDYGHGTNGELNIISYYW